MTSTLEHAEIGHDISPTITARNSKEPPIVSQPICMAPSFSKRPGQQIANNSDGLSYALTTGQPPVVTKNQAVRRLTPTECERLQGFPDGHTDITFKGKSASDGPRYKALGNSMAVPVIRWLGEGIEMQS